VKTTVEGFLGQKRKAEEQVVMGTFHLDCEIENWTTGGQKVAVQMLVDTGSEHTWIPRKLLESIGVTPQKKDLTFEMANGSLITRSIGFAIVRYGSFSRSTKLFFWRAR